jgi:threonine dehydrogenase-like Zn-dependent dehydrogenase
MSLTVGTHVAPRFLGGGRVGRWERPVPDPGHGELLIEVRANAVCGTDRGAWQRGSDVVPGHEIAGVVVVAGSGTRIAPGTSGVVHLMDTCGACRSCLAGATNQCLDKRGDIGFTRDGGYGTHVLVRERQLFPVPDAVDPAEATLLLDVIGTSTHALRRGLAAVDDVRVLLVVGAGPVGLGVVAVARHVVGPDVVVVVSDVEPYRLRLAAALHARPLDVSAGALSDGLAALGVTPDLAVDTSGRQAAREEALHSLARRGALVCVGHGERLDVDVSCDLIAHERAVLGSEYFRFDELPSALDILRRDRERIASIITHRLSPDAIEDAFRLFLSGRTGKVVMVR